MNKDYIELTSIEVEQVIKPLREKLVEIGHCDELGIAGLLTLASAMLMLSQRQQGIELTNRDAWLAKICLDVQKTAPNASIHILAQWGYDLTQAHMGFKKGNQ